MTASSKKVCMGHKNWEAACRNKNVVLIWSIMKHLHSRFGEETKRLISDRYTQCSDTSHKTYDEFIADYREIVNLMVENGFKLDEDLMVREFRRKITKTKSSSEPLRNWLADGGKHAMVDQIIDKIEEIRMEAYVDRMEKLSLGEANKSFFVSNKSNSGKSSVIAVGDKGQYANTFCYNCWIFGHAAKYCPSPPKSCKLCHSVGAHTWQFCNIMSIAKVEEAFKDEVTAARSRNATKTETKSEKYSENNDRRNRSHGNGNYKKKQFGKVEGVHAAIESVAEDDEFFLFVGIESEDIDETDNTVEPDVPDDEVHHITLRLSQAPQYDLKLIGDNGTTCNLVNRLDMLQDVQPVTRRIKITGVGGSVYVTHVGYLNVFGKTYYADQPHNLLSLDYLVTVGYEYHGYDQGLIVTKNGQTVLTFHRPSGGLNYISFGDLEEKVEHAYSLVDTLLSGKKYYTKEQLSRAAEVMVLHYSLSHPNDQALGIALSTGNSHLTKKDVEVYRQVYGPCQHCTLAKLHHEPAVTSTSQHAVKVGNLHIDLLPFKNKTFGGYTFAIFSVDEFSHFVYLKGIKTKNATDVLNGLLNMISFYKARDHTISIITCDAESVFIGLESSLGNIGIELVIRNPGRHERLAERVIQSLKSKDRAVRYSLTKIIPDALRFELLCNVAQGMNSVPNKFTGNITPLEIVTGRKPNFNRVPFGTMGISKMMDSPGGVAVMVVGHTFTGFRVYYDGAQQILTRQQVNFDVKLAIPFAWPDRVMPDPLKQVPIEVISDAPVESYPGSATDQVELVVDDVNLEGDAVDIIDESNDAADVIDESNDIIIDESNISDSITSNEYSIATNIISSNEDITRSEGVTGVNSLSEGVNQSLANTVRRKRSEMPTTGGYLTRNQKRQQQLRAFITLSDISPNEYVYFAKENEKLTIKKALKSERKGEAEAAMIAEIEVFMELGVLSWVKFTDIPARERKNIIRLFMFIKYKYLSDGTFDKVKARLVADGSRQTPDTYGETATTTLHPATFMMLLTKAVNCNGKLKVYDVPSAFLHTKNTRVMFVQINRELAEVFVKRRPDVKIFVANDGSLYARLEKIVYGTKQASFEFGFKLKGLLISIGYYEGDGDKSLMVKYLEDGSYINIGILIVVSNNLLLFKELEDMFMREFGGIKIQEGNKLSYLGTTIHIKEDGTIFINKEGFVADLIEKSGIKESEIENMPHGVDFLCNKKSKAINQTNYLSVVMGLMHLARMIRLDILFATTYLASRSANPTEDDMNKVRRIIKYLYGTQDYGIHIVKHDIKLELWADASHGTHIDMKGHSGLIITLGGGPLFWKSVKQKLVALSSTESEIMALKEALTYVCWVKLVLDDLQISYSDTIVYQDNESAIKIIENDGTFDGSKHYKTRIAYCQQVIRLERVNIVWKSTKEMIADILTKALPRIDYLYFVECLMSTLLNSKLNLIK